MEKIIQKNLMQIKKLIDIGLNEDLDGEKDVTSNAIFSNEIGKYNIMAKQNGVLCGIEVAELVFKRVDRSINFLPNFKDGENLKKTDIVATIEGKIKNILAAERTALNLLGYLSGISTMTYQFVSAAKFQTIILDTRKIIPGYRILAKYAVSCGKGENHRFGLYDMIMIKDRHIDAAGSIKNAVEKVRKKYGNKYPIEVETASIEEVKEALECNVDRIMLDNMSFENIKKALNVISNKAEVEVSGNVTLESIESLASLKPTYVSIGALTHSVKNFDFTMKYAEEK